MLLRIKKEEPQNQLEFYLKEFVLVTMNDGKSKLYRNGHQSRAQGNRLWSPTSNNSL